MPHSEGVIHTHRLVEVTPLQTSTLQTTTTTTTTYYNVIIMHVLMGLFLERKRSNNSWH